MTRYTQPNRSGPTIVKTARDKLSPKRWESLQRFLSKAPNGEETNAQAYEEMRTRLCSFFRWKGCISPEEYTDATFDRVGRTLLDGKQIREEQPRKYILGVARLIFLERSKREIRQKVAEDTASSQTDLPNSDIELRLRALEECLKEWSIAGRQQLLDYHRSQGGARIIERKTLAEQQGIPLNTLRIRMHRNRQKLEKCVRGKL